jgi:hypothetical protein
VKITDLAKLFDRAGASSDTTMHRPSGRLTRSLSGAPLVPGTRVPSWSELVQPPRPGSPADVHGTAGRPWNSPRRRVGTVRLDSKAGPGQRAERRAQRRANGMMGENHQRLTTHTPKAARAAQLRGTAPHRIVPPQPSTATLQRRGSRHA